MIIVGPGDNLLNIAVAKAAANHSFYLSVANGLNPTDDLTPGTILKEVQPIKENHKSFEELLSKIAIEPTKNYIALPNQSLYDIAAQENGTAFAVIDWAFKNGFNPTDDLISGQKFLKVDSNYTHSMRVKHFTGKNIKLVTYRNTIETNPPTNLLNYYLPGVLPYSL